MNAASEARALRTREKLQMEESIITALNYAFASEDEEMVDEVLEYAIKVGQFTVQDAYDIYLDAIEKEEEILSGKDI